MTRLSLLRGLAFVALAAVVGLAAAQLQRDLARPPEVQAQSPVAAGGAAVRRAAPTNFRITVDGLPASTFVRFETMAEQLGVVEYRDGGELVARKRPGPPAVHDLVCYKNVGEVVPGLQTWWNACENGQLDRRQITIELLEGRGERLRQWKYVNAWPSKWEVKVVENGAPTEAITFSAEAIEFE